MIIPVPYLNPEKARVAPSGENAIDSKLLHCSSSSIVVTSVCVAMSHSLILPFRAAEARVEPSGENATDLTLPRCP